MRRKALLITMMVAIAAPAQKIPELATPQVAPATVSRGMVWSHLREQISVLGDRMLAKGKERMTLTGSITRAGQPARPIAITRDIGGRARIQEQTAAGSKVVGFDGKNPWVQSGSAADLDQELLESLSYDSAERFYYTQAFRVPTRFVGTRVRFDDGKAAEYNGPYYDVYLVKDSVNVSGTETAKNKFYCINWKTMLLERVQYTVARGGRPVAVETVLSDWKSIDGQQVPTKIIRLEGGRAVFTVDVLQAAFVPHASDSVFVGPAR